MRTITVRQLQAVAWGLSAVVTVAAITVWVQHQLHHSSELSTYSLFPLFGLLAFSLMWSHYIASVMRQYFKVDRSALHTYFEVTSTIVLVALLLHPGLLIWQLWRDGLGLPPGSYLEYVGKSMQIFVIMGTISWFAFLSYELRRKFSKRSWWRFVGYASDIAMILIFIHALNLGHHLQEGWFKMLWYFYGATLLGALIYIHSQKRKKLV